MNNSKTIREVLEKVDGIAFANGKVNGISAGDYRISDAEIEIKKLIKQTFRKRYGRDTLAGIICDKITELLFIK